MTSPKPESVDSDGVGPTRRGGRRTTKPRTVQNRKVNTGTSASEKELTEALADCLAVGLAAYFQYLAQVPRESRDVLEITEEEARAIAKPFSRLIEKHASSQAAGVVAGSKDWIVAVAAIMAYTDRVGPVMRASREQRSVEKQAKQRSFAQSKETRRNGSVRPVQETAVPGPEFTVGTPGGYGLGPQHTQD